MKVLSLHQRTIWQLSEKFWERTLRPHRTVRINNYSIRLDMNLTKQVNIKYIYNFFRSRIMYLNKTLLWDLFKNMQCFEHTLCHNIEKENITLFKNLIKSSDVKFWKKNLITITVKPYDYILYTLRIEQLDYVKSMLLNDLLTNLCVRDLFRDDLMQWDFARDS